MNIHAEMTNMAHKQELCRSFNSANLYVHEIERTQEQQQCQEERN